LEGASREFVLASPPASAFNVNANTNVDALVDKAPGMEGRVSAHDDLD
jgi:hypothetical protein